MNLESKIRNIPDFPKAGIGFKDITTLLKDANAFNQAVDDLSMPFLEKKIDRVVGIESRGFIFGGAMALKLNAGFVPIRKQGKLPAAILAETYELEYGTDTIEIHKDAIQESMQILIVDDLLATGGTAAATIRLIQKLGGEIIGFAFLIELDFLHGRKKLGNIPIHVLIHYDNE
jgi:adenine phosphoribosyltransferase